MKELVTHMVTIIRRNKEIWNVFAKGFGMSSKSNFGTMASSVSFLETEWTLKKIFRCINSPFHSQMQ